MLAPRVVSPPTGWLELFIRRSQIRQHSAKKTIIHDGDEPETLYYILDGSVSVSIENDNGQKFVLAYLSEGDFFGEMGLFGEASVRSASIVTRTKCELAEISYEIFSLLAAEKPDILFVLTAQMARRLRKTSNNICDFESLKVNDRVVSTLFDLAKIPNETIHPNGK
jgi:CRP/FNR family cyclic AMP-dependent transcriptional regulator